jgi:TRAP-type C4-dicarboxylate transport system substrate-binding protein
MKRNGLLVGLMLLTLGLAATAVEARTVIKLATLVPDGSVWDQALNEMGADWQERSDGRVTLRIYPGGVAGDEPDVVRKMRIGQIHAASLTVTGLAEIDPAFKVFTIPLFWDSYEELLFVLEAMEPYLAARRSQAAEALCLGGTGRHGPVVEAVRLQAGGAGGHRHHDRVADRHDRGAAHDPAGGPQSAVV